MDVVVNKMQKLKEFTNEESTGCTIYDFFLEIISVVMCCVFLEKKYVDSFVVAMREKKRLSST